MFKKILIANRGEIACRIIHTARKMGIATVAVYSDTDRAAKHVQLADEAIALGGMTAQDSYLQADKIIAACHETGAQAVHPGHGFLSEQASFATALEKADIAFIGAGVGKFNIFHQLEDLKIPCIDIGFVFEVWANEENKLLRPYMVNDSEWDNSKINF